MSSQVGGTGPRQEAVGVTRPTCPFRPLHTRRRLEFHRESRINAALEPRLYDDAEARITDVG